MTLDLDNQSDAAFAKALTPCNLLLVCSFARSIIPFRGDLIKALESNGFSVLCAIPESDSSYQHVLTANGINSVCYPLARSGLNPFKDLITIFALTRLIKERNIKVVFPYTIKPVIYASLAARITSTPTVALISGLGFTFSRASRKARLLEALNTFLYRLAISKNTKVIFQNTDDMALFAKQGITRVPENCSYVDGSGVNITRFSENKTETKRDAVKFLMVARLIKEKGVLLYIQAAEKLKEEFPNATFTLVGVTESTPSAVHPDVIQSHHEKGTLRFTGQLDDVRPEYQTADVFVLPSYYREGIPRSILEALASGLAIITTDSPGCRETVEIGKNGYLIEPKNASDLASKMRELLTDPEKVRAMGSHSRKLAEQQFNVNVINQQMLPVFFDAISAEPNK